MKHNITVQQLRTAGHKVRVAHFRRVSHNPADVKSLLTTRLVHIKHGKFNEFLKTPTLAEVRPIILSHGGFTQVEVTSKSGQEYKATAKATTKKGKPDCFNRRNGLKVALGRIVVAAEANGETLV